MPTKYKILLTLLILIIGISVILYDNPDLSRKYVLYDYYLLSRSLFISKYLNVPIDRMCDLSKKCIDDNIPVWFGSDVGQFLHSKSAVLDQNTFDYVNYLDLDDSMNKKERIEFCESLMTHAMVYVGYNTDQYGSVNYWKIENSWGTTGPYAGNLICSDSWFKQYTYQLIIPKKYITPDELNTWNGDVMKSFPIWDPMGSLAA